MLTIWYSSHACNTYLNALMAKGKLSKSLEVCTLLAQLGAALAHCLQISGLLAVLQSHDLYKSRIVDDFEYGFL